MTYKLRTTLEVDEEQIRHALRTEVDQRLHGPEFSTRDEVVFTEAIMAQGETDEDENPFDWEPPEVREALQPGRPAIVASHDADRTDKPYAVFLVDAKGAISRLNVAADQIARRPE